MEIGSVLTKIFALATLGGNLLALGVVILFIVRRSIVDRMMVWLAKWAMWIGFIFSSGATIGSLVYSQIVGYPACILCWIQRVFMYPQMLLFGLALWRKERLIAPYLLLLSLVGAAVALYQWVKDMLLLYTHTVIPCPAVSGLPSCDKIYVLEFGYITLSMFAFNVFFWLSVILYACLSKRYETGQHA